MTGLPFICALARPALLLADGNASVTGSSRMAALVQHSVAWGVVLSAVALWLMLPRGGAKGRRIGAVLGIAALGCFASMCWSLGPWSSNLVFWILSAVTIVSATCTVTFRSPVYCAVWFAMTLTGTAGIFMVQGAQFLGVATIVVYAGAILVTFLFVLMLASPKGNAYYDRVSWEAMLAAATGAVLVSILSMTIGKLSLDQARAPTTAALENDVLSPDHVARLGGELFGRHLIAVEVAGTLLLVALVGATAIVSAQKRRIEGPSIDDRGHLNLRTAGSNGEPSMNYQEAPR